jgi:HAD superfamily hydrolase (TIGR01490 family)
MPQSFAFFDLDHTLLPFDTQALFCDFVLKRERWRTARHLLFFPVALGKACKLVSTVTAKRAFLGYLAGMRRETLSAYAAEFAEKCVKPWVYPELLAIVEGHRKAGRVLVLNTASPEFYAHDIARVLGFDHCVATKVDIGEVVPRWPSVVGENNKREAKIVAMKREIPAVATASEEALRESWSYSDSSADLPLLNFAGHGVLVHPSARLAAIGREKGWEIMHPARPYGSKVGDMLAALMQVLGAYRAAPSS